MEQKYASRPMALKDVRITDAFWKSEMELVRREVIPYQWSALNDAVEGAAPSYCIHNFKAAIKLNQTKERQGSGFKPPVYTFRGFEALPNDPQNPDDNFYGFVFQDSDLYKWIEAASYSLTQHPDARLEALIDEAVELICGAQQENGYLDTYYILNGMDKIFSNLRDNHELYCLGHLIEAAVAHYEATGKDLLLNCACRFADYVRQCFGPEPGQRRGYPGHEIAEMALVRLYEVTHCQDYLDLARFFIDERGQKPCYYDNETHENTNEFFYEYLQAHRPVREQDEAVGHAVRAVYLYSGMADIARLTGDTCLRGACRTLWNNIAGQKLYITGGIGGTHIGESFSYDYDLPNDTAYAETCASIGLVFFARRMLEIEANACYADVMERALYNCVLSGMAQDGKSFFYVNPLEVYPEACHKDMRIAHVKPVRQKWFGCACCPPNLARLISSLGSYAYTQNEDTLFIHLYVGGQIHKSIGQSTLSVAIDSTLPWSGKVRIRIESAGDEEPVGAAEAADTPGAATRHIAGGCSALAAAIALRIPEWCGGDYSIRVPEGCTQMIKNGYLYIRGAWKAGDTIDLNFSMPVRILEANPLVREDIGKAAVTRGPLVYCLEEADNQKLLHLLTLDCASGAAPTLEDMSICGAAIKAIDLAGFRQQLPQPQAPMPLYMPAAQPQRTPVTLRFVPYFVWGNRGENEMCVWVRKA